MHVHNIYDGHGTEDKEQRGGNIAKSTHQLQFQEFESKFVQRHLAKLGEHGQELRYVLRWIYQEEVVGIEQEDEP